jgi:hypothetical protein
MKKHLLLALTIMSFINLSAQDSIPRLSIEFSWNHHKFAMDTLAKYVIEPGINNIVQSLDKRIESGSGYNFKIGYQVSKAFQVGLYGDFQRGISEYKPMYPMGNSPSIEGFYSVRVENLNAGIHMTYWLNSLIDLSSKRFFKRLNLGLSGHFGYARGSFKQLSYVPINEFAVSRFRVFTDDSFIYKFELKAEYNISQRNLFSFIGVKAGYQYFKTDYVKTQVGEDELSLGSNVRVMLDFSGFYYGVYLKLAR